MDNKSQMTDRQQLSMDALIGSSKLFTKVLKDCGIDKENDYLRWKLARQILREGAEHRIIRVILSSMEAKHVAHFESLLNSHLVANPNFNFEAVLFQVAILYPDIQIKVFESLEEFFITFVENYKTLYS